MQIRHRILSTWSIIVPLKIIRMDITWWGFETFNFNIIQFQLVFTIPFTNWQPQFNTKNNQIMTNNRPSILRLLLSLHILNSQFKNYNVDQ